MTKETIPQSIEDKINKEADDHAVVMSDGLNSHAFNLIKDTFRQAAKWGAFELDKWISVKDGLPEEGEIVLAYHSAGIEFVKYERGNFYRQTSPAPEDRIINFYWNDITHYQYLPKPPKDI